MPEHKQSKMDKELDDLSLRILELMNEHIECEVAVERAVRSGCLALAKTRYIQGNTNSVSAMKIPTEDLTATTTVLRSESSEAPRFELNREVGEKGSGDKGRGANREPIKWFGFLVPTSLRQGQSWFNKALDLTIDGANITTEISASLDTYTQLLNEKQSLKTNGLELSQTEAG